jgi:murein DD-endopeptidase MepM/ murein hydrolase activator NlpD
VLRIAHQLVKNIVVSRRKFPITVLTSVPGFTPKKIISTVENKENTALKKVLADISDAPYSAKPFINPLSEITIVGNYGDIRKSGKLTIQHLGVDLKAPLGTSVMAVNDGRVVFEASMPDYGNTLVIDHGLGVYSLYLHLSEFKVAQGDMVQQGQTVALSGATGYVTGPHLHFSIKMRGASVDPLKFIETSNAKY